MPGSLASSTLDPGCGFGHWDVELDARWRARWRRDLNAASQRFRERAERRLDRPAPATRSSRFIATLIITLAAQPPRCLPIYALSLHSRDAGGLIILRPRLVSRLTGAPAGITSIASSRARSRPTCRCRRPTKFELVDQSARPRRRSASTVPPALLARADEVIE